MNASNILGCAAAVMVGMPASAADAANLPAN
jgi:hypothetical protein